MYIIPVKADTIEDTIQVDGELGVAEYFLINDDAVTIPQRLFFAIFSDYILNLLCALIKINPRKLYLRHIYYKLNAGMYSDFCWGDERLVNKYFAPLRNIVRN